MCTLARKRNKSSHPMYFEKRHKQAPFRNSIFIHSSQDQDRSTRRLNILIRVILSVLIVIAAVFFLVFIFGYLLPFLQSELSADGEENNSEVTSVYIEPNPVYDENGIQIYDNSITLYLINSKYPGDKDEIPERKKVEGIEVSKYMSESLEVLLEAAKKDGYLLEINQGYVSYEEQEILYEEKVEDLIKNEGFSNVMARTEAKTYTPVAGESDYQTGMCVMISNDPESFENSLTYLWLNRNMADYGFVFRYPKGKESETGIKQNLCVLRYVGKENAQRMRQLSMCLEEYVNYLENQKN